MKRIRSHQTASCCKAIPSLRRTSIFRFYAMPDPMARYIGMSLFILLITVGVTHAQDTIHGSPDSFPLESSIGVNAISNPTPPASLTVVGEIRTINENGQPRLWGGGRHKAVRYGTTGVESGLCRNDSATVEFGLSTIAVHWQGVAEACPAGTWVCTVEDFEDEFFICDTALPELAYHATSCDGMEIDDLPDNHFGWSESGWNEQFPMWRFSESGGWAATGTPCEMYPVWCCSVVQP